MADAVTTIPPTSTNGSGAFSLWWSKARTSFFWTVFVAFALRFGWIVVAHTYKFKTLDDNFSFGWEMGRIGRSLAQGQGFGNPFSEITGPTAWEPPLYPFLIAGVFKLFGVYTHASALVLLGINSFFSALTCIPIFLIAKRCFDEKLAIWTAWLWAVMPPVMYWCTRWVWETSLAALLLALVFWLALDLGERDGFVPWFEFGLLWGIAALTNTSLLAFLPASGLWAWHQRWKRGKSSLARVALSALVFLACVAPWLARNHRILGVASLRSNFGAELRIGNGPGADGTWREYLHPTQNVYEMHRYQQMGEIAYVAERKREALAFIHEDYARFVSVSLKRFVYYWGGVPRLSEIAALAPVKNSVFLASSVLAFWGLGLALRQHRPGAWLFLWLILLYPAVYYVVFPHPRYRHPIEPELGILMVYVISEARKNQQQEQSSARAAG
jgi:4-amino-4-deoxy-L-arabinose transferase-like glycosyltransferase